MALRLIWLSLLVFEAELSACMQKQAQLGGKKASAPFLRLFFMPQHTTMSV